ncbi:MAG: transcription antitermination factor NusB [Myxococcaceae bacterium]|nr:transcription antitermination factor NusB [Myxococcaceae bacterium]
MGARRIARERALQALYQLDLQGEGPSVRDALEAAWGSETEGAEAATGAIAPDMKQFALELVEGVRQKLAELDAQIEKHSTNWRIDRMSRIDRNVLRLGAYELAHRPDVPKKVALNEAVELGKKFGTEESSSFINGLLDKLAQGIDKP